MKKLFVLIVCLILVIGVSAINQKNEKIPEAVQSGFAAKFSTVQKVKWSIEKPGEFEAEFTLNKVETSALFDAKGNLLETETEINEKELPKTVKTMLTKDFGKYKFDEIEKVTDSKGVVTFEMEAAKGKDKLEISFDSNGKLLKKEPMKEANEKD